MPAKLPSLPAVMKGVAFENRSLTVLREHLSMSLRRVGGKGDGGIDLQGWWWLPSECLSSLYSSSTHLKGSHASPRTPLRVLAQCKAEVKKIGPRFIREFEGTIMRNSAYLPVNEPYENPADCTRNVVVGLFLSTSQFTKASLLQAYSSPIPLALMHLPEVSYDLTRTNGSSSALAPEPSTVATDNSLGALVFNPALKGAAGLLRGLEPRWERSLHSPLGRPGLWSNGRRVKSWTPEDGDYHNESRD